MTEPIKLIINGARGPSGQGVSGDERLMYIVDVTVTSGFGGEAIPNVILNSVGNIFQWSKSGDYIRCTFTDNSFLQKILSLNYYAKSESGYYHSINTADDYIDFAVGGDSDYRIMFEFFI